MNSVEEKGAEGLQRNEMMHPPTLDSVHISTHPNKKSKAPSRFNSIASKHCSGVSSSTEPKRALAEVDYATTGVGELKAMHQTARDVQSTTYINLETSTRALPAESEIPPRRVNTCLNTPKKPTTVMLPHRAIHRLQHNTPSSRPTDGQLRNSHSVESVHDEKRHKRCFPVTHNTAASHTRWSTETSSGTFSFGDASYVINERVNCSEDEFRDVTSENDESVESVYVDVPSSDPTAAYGPSALQQQNVSEQGKTLKDFHVYDRRSYARQQQAVAHDSKKSDVEKSLDTAVSRQYTRHVAETYALSDAQFDPCGAPTLNGVARVKAHHVVPRFRSNAGDVGGKAFSKGDRTQKNCRNARNGYVCRDPPSLCSSSNCLPAQYGATQAPDALTQKQDPVYSFREANGQGVTFNSSYQNAAHEPEPECRRPIDPVVALQCNGTSRQPLTDSSQPDAIHNDKTQRAHLSAAEPAGRLKPSKKHPVVIMCKVPETEEGFLKKLTPLRAPSRRSVIPRKLPRPPTTGFQRDDLQPTSRYYRYVRQFEEKERRRRVNEDVFVLNASEEFEAMHTEPPLSREQQQQQQQLRETPLHSTLTVPDRAHQERHVNAFPPQKRARRAPFSTVVVPHVTNVPTSANAGTVSTRPLTRVTPVAVSFSGASQQVSPRASFSNNRNVATFTISDDAEKSDNKFHSSKDWKQHMISVITVHFSLAAGRETCLTPSIVGTHTCDWFWPLVTDDALWRGACSKICALFDQAHSFSSRVKTCGSENYRHLFRFAVALIAEVLGELSSLLSSSSHKERYLVNSLNDVRRNQEERVLMTVLHDVLRLWVQASFRIFDAKPFYAPDASLSTTHLLLPYTSVTKDSLQRCTEIQKSYVNSLRSTVDYLQTLASQVFTSPLVSQHSRSGFSVLQNLIRDHEMFDVERCRPVITHSPQGKPPWGSTTADARAVAALKSERHRLRLLVQRQSFERRVLENRLLEHRLQGWLAALALFTLKSLDAYIGVRRCLKGQQGSSVHVKTQCVRCGTSVPQRTRLSQFSWIHSPFVSAKDEDASTLSFRSETASVGRRMTLFSDIADCVGYYCTNCGHHYDVSLIGGGYRRRISRLNPSLDGCSPADTTTGRGSFGRSSVGRLSLLSFVSLDDQQTDTAAAHFTGEVLRHEDSRFSALSCSPQKPQRRSFNDTTTVSTKLVGNEAKQHRSPYGLGYASVRVSQRRRRTTLGYALRLQKPK